MAALPHSVRAAAASWVAFLSGKHPSIVVRLKENVPYEDDLDAASQRDAPTAARRTHDDAVQEAS